MAESTVSPRAHYVVYTRTESGILERAHDRLELTAVERAAHYPYREPLAGWPEHAVFWSRETGSAIGVAPMGAS